MTVQEYAVKLRGNISKIIKGKDDRIDLIIMALLSGGHVLLDDVPGTGKTVLAKEYNSLLIFCRRISRAYTSSI